MRYAPVAGDSRRQPVVCGEACRCSRGVLLLPVQVGESVCSFGGQLASKGAHDALCDNIMQELGLAVNALSSTRSAVLFSERKTPGVLPPCGAPEGWSWAVFLCHDAISTGMNTALHQFSLSQVLVGDMQSPAFLHRQAPSLAPYVDTASLIALTGDKVFTALVAELRLQGFVF